MPLWSKYKAIGAFCYHIYYSITYRNLADTVVNTSSASYSAGYNAGKSNALGSARSYQYSTYINIYDYGGETDKQVGSYTASKSGKVAVSFIGIQHKITGGNATVNQKLYRNGSVISTSNYNAVLDLNAGDTIKSTITLKFEQSSSSYYYGFYTGAMVVTEIN